ncbi:ABC transporter permease [Halodesulfurarchaeum sp.]|uniref:ABC transporter permease n=1 Tax=Halodesulfurarchaeum sp. TaxID=1980530 RepID=UPI002FC37757
MIDRGTLARTLPSSMMAWRNLWRNKVRTGLATAGIVIAVVAIAGIGITGTALEYGMTEDLGDLTNQVTVVPGADTDEDGLTAQQIEELERVARGSTVVPVKTDRVPVSTRGGTSVVKVEAMTEPDELYSAAAGTVPDTLRTGALVSQSMAQEYDLTVGGVVTLEGDAYRILGILEPSDLPGMGSGDGTDTVVVPESALPDQLYSEVTIFAADGDAAEVIATDLEATFNSREEIVDADTQSDLQDRISSTFETLNLALLGIGSISLVVASVSILNVMLMSVVERRSEIGVLRAVGIRRTEVMRMILAEALFLGVLGALLGAVLSFGIGIGINAMFFDDPLLLLRWDSFKFLVAGFGFGVLASLVSGLYPAWKAANDPPVEALRG